ncbi:hypothetical protein MUGA111182_19995 [Mucilaginibacter galii]|uniref:Uncharacterized protein n=1 Tax=Mucilaginibacter galii TaxID=2005073 RepID=A0A917JC37_9SPHI|nr:hypothetical protein [Mucilaginibacter galii]GGI52374.1 hypothetical protein GCM10011425_35860 [Mucilaginibacter galii]
MDIPVKNIFDLQAEIIRLEKVKQEQEMVLKQRFNSPSAIFASVRSIFPQSPEGEQGGGVGSLFSPDIVGLISRFVLPLALNKTLFKNSGFIVKTLVGLASQKASSYISEDSVTSVWGRVKSLFGKKPSTAVKASTVKQPVIKEPLIQDPIIQATTMRPSDI